MYKVSKAFTASSLVRISTGFTFTFLTKDDDKEEDEKNLRFNAVPACGKTAPALPIVFMKLFAARRGTVSTNQGKRPLEGERHLRETRRVHAVAIAFPWHSILLMTATGAPKRFRCRSMPRKRVVRPTQRQGNECLDLGGWQQTDLEPIDFY